MAGPLCKCCSNPKLAEINKALLDETRSYRDIHAEFGIAKSTLANHKARCMGAPTIPDVAERARFTKAKRERMAATSRVAYLESTLPSKEELGDVLGQCISRLDKIVARAEKNGADVVGISGIDAIRKQVGDLARLAGHVGSNGPMQANVQVNIAMTANDIGASIAQHLGSIKPVEALEMVGEIDE